MATPSDRRRQKTIAKQKQRRESAQDSRRRRTTKLNAPRGEASEWPVHEAWISENWHEWEVRLHAIITRKHSGGALAYAAFEIDLADDGLVGCKVESGVAEGNVQRAIVERSQGSAMMLTTPPNVARLVQEALDWRQRRALPAPKGLSDALDMLDGIDADDARFDYMFGREDEEEPTSEVPARQGLWTRLRSMFS